MGRGGYVFYVMGKILKKCMIGVFCIVGMILKENLVFVEVKYFMIIVKI